MEIARWKAADGRSLRMREARASDLDQVKSSLNKLSPEARRNRFFSPMPGFSDELVRKLTIVDRANEYVVLVMRKEDGFELPVAGGRILVLQDGFSHYGEFALVVGDDWQKQGIGSRIMQALIEEAKRRQLAWLFGHVLRDNAKMHALAHAFNFRFEDDADPDIEKIILDLPSKKSWGSRLVNMIDPS
ncbi:MAG: GNAT family N-acetyltransferase [Zoogloeaceae bacterium]|nr:GNAT family N-acetyltransferase [Zoogloeaceae bacterium]